VTARAGLALLVAALAVSTCGREPVPPLRVGTFPGPGGELLSLAQHRGWLAPADFRLVEFINDGEVVRAFGNGSIEAAYLTVDELLLLARNGLNPVVLLVSAESRGADAILAQNDVGSLGDLEGRRVAVPVNSSSAYLFRRALQRSSLDASDLQVVNLPPDRHRRAFLRREVDAVVTTEPFRSEIAALGGVELYNSTSMPFEIVTVLAIRGDDLAVHGDRLAALCTAWYRAGRAVHQAQEARNEMAARMRVTPEMLSHMLDTVRLIDASESHSLLGPPRPLLASTAARVQSVLVESGLLPEAAPLDRLFAWPTGINQAACRG
jgi:NitT/TauT family transport system substrate-binding protein